MAEGMACSMVRIIMDRYPPICGEFAWGTCRAQISDCPKRPKEMEIKRSLQIIALLTGVQKTRHDPNTYVNRSLREPRGSGRL